MTAIWRLFRELVDLSGKVHISPKIPSVGGGIFPPEEEFLEDRTQKNQKIELYSSYCRP
jgi:hypothetical protein